MSRKKLIKYSQPKPRRGLSRFYSNRLSYEELINAESELGKTLFGPIPTGTQREFFESKKNVWIWHQSYLDGQGRKHVTTIRYEVRPNGVFKNQNGSGYQKIEGAELDNLRQAAAAYLNIVKTRLYS